MNYAGIDPSTKTGLIVLNNTGEAIIQKEIHLKNGIKSTDKELLAYGRNIVSLIPEGSLVAIEGFSYGSQGKGVSTQYAVGYSIRFALLDAGFIFVEAAPSQLKKFATGKGNTKKDNMTIPILRLWNFEHPSDNVRDAYVLAQIVKAMQNHDAELLAHEYHQYQLEVLGVIVNPFKPEVDEF